MSGNVVPVLVSIAVLEAVAIVVLSVLLLRSRKGIRKGVAPSNLLIPVPREAVEVVLETANLVRTEGIGAAVLSSIEQLARWAEDRPAELSELTTDGMAVVMFSDIESSTEANVRMGDRAWVELIEENSKQIGELVEEYSGHVVKNQGDGLMIAFPRPDEAVHCGIAIQRMLSTNAYHDPDHAIRMRIGINMGKSIQQGDDLFGRNVALAARVAAEATGGETLVTQSVHDAVDDVSYGLPREAEFKGFRGTFCVYPVQSIGYARAPGSPPPN
jgi:adenylate cyclase